MKERRKKCAPAASITDELSTSSYLYKIGKKAAHDDYVILLAEIGGGKGKVTRHYILEGVKLILEKIRVEEVFKRHGITPKIQGNIKNTLGA